MNLPSLQPGEPPYCAPPDPAPRKPTVAFPPLACDTHAHVFGPMSRYAYFGKRIYTPPDATLESWFALHAVLGVERAVLVQPSVYSTDNACMLDAMAVAGNRLRGIAVVDESIGDAELKRMHDRGVRGIRFNIVDVRPEERGKLPVDAVRRMAARIAPLGWHIQFLMHVDEFPEMDRLFAGLPVDVVIDHFGYMKVTKGLDHPGFVALQRMLAAGRAWVKFTGAYRISADGALPYADVTPYARALVAANPERIVWGTDWPHPKHEGPMPNDGDFANCLGDWIPDATNLRRALADNPAKLYGF